MTTLTEGTHTGEFIVSEANGFRSRETITVASGNDLKACTVLGIVTASDKYAVFNQDAVDGTEAAAAILFADADATSADVTDAVAMVRDCEVRSQDLVWPSDIEAAEQAAAEAELKALGIIVRS